MKKLLLGLVGGLSLGMLFAPEKGASLRDKLAKSDNKIKEFGNALMAAGTDASDEVKSILDSKEVKELISKGKAGTDDIIAKGKNLSEKGQAELQNIVEKAKEKKGTISSFFSKK